MRKLSIFMIAVMAFGLVACKRGGQSSSVVSEKSEELTTTKDIDIVFEEETKESISEDTKQKLKKLNKNLVNVKNDYADVYGFMLQGRPTVSFYLIQIIRKPICRLF